MGDAVGQEAQSEYPQGAPQVYSQVGLDERFQGEDGRGLRLRRRLGLLGQPGARAEGEMGGAIAHQGGLLRCHSLFHSSFYELSHACPVPETLVTTTAIIPRALPLTTSAAGWYF